MFTNKKGSVIIDAAICVPAFVIAIGMLLGILIQAGKEEAAFERMSLAAQASLAAELGEDEIEISFPAGKAVMHLCYRPWTGAKDDADKKDKIVYIFPKFGERYHIPGCSLIKEYPENYEAVTMSEAEERGFSACKLCVGGLHLFEGGPP